jgi:hypothetical protein
MAVFTAAEQDHRPMSSDSTSDFLTSQSDSGRSRSDVLQQFLSGNRAPKTVQLIVLVVLAASRGVETGENAHKSLILANEVICAIPAEIRGNWCVVNTAVVRKLQEKACVGDATELVQLLTLRFVANLCGPRMLSDKLLARIETTFIDRTCVRAAKLLLNRMDGLDVLADIVNRGKIDSLILSAIEYATTADVLDVVCLNALTETMQDLLTIGNDEATSTSLFTPSLMNGLLRLQQRLGSLTLASGGAGGQPRESVNRNPIGSCISSTRQAVAALAQATCRLLLEISLASNHTPSMSASMQSLVLNLYSQSSKDDPSCQHKRPSAVRSLEFIEQSATQDLSSTDWRSALKARFGHEADTVIHSIGKACAALEARCENIEQPLREANEKYRIAEQQNAELSSAYAQIEALNIDLGIQNHALEDERDKIARDLEDSRNVTEELTGHISNLKDSLAEQEATSRQRLHELESTIAVGNVSYLASLAGKESALEDLHNRVKSLEADVAEKESIIAASYQTVEMMRSEAETLKTSRDKAVEDHEHLAEANKQEIAIRNDLIQELKENVATYKAESESLKSDSTLMSAERDALVINLEQKRSQIQKLEQAVLGAQQEKALLEQAHQQAMATMTQKLTALHESSLSAQQAYQAELDNHNSTIAQLQSHVHHLQSKCERKSAQIIEANVLRSNLLAAMGVPASAIAQQSGTETPYNLPTALPHRSRSPSLSFTAQHPSAAPQHQQQQDPDLEHSPPTPSSSTSFTDESSRRPPRQRQQPQTHPATVSFASTNSTSSNASNSTQHGPTPKRARPRRSTAQQQQPSSPTKTRNSMGPTTVSTASSALRANVGASRRQTLGVLTSMMDDDDDLGEEESWMRKGAGSS